MNIEFKMTDFFIIFQDLNHLTQNLLYESPSHFGRW